MSLTWWLIYLLCLLLIIKIINYVWNKRRIYILSWNTPGPVALPIVGNALLFLCKNEDILEIVLNIVFKYPSPMRLWFGPKFTILFSKAEQVEKIVTSSKFNNKDNIYRFLKPFIGEGLISGSGPKWRNDRKVLQPFFVKKTTSGYFPEVLNHTKILIDVFRKQVNQPTFNVQKIINRCVIDIINETMMGIKTYSHDGSLDYFLSHIKKTYILIHARAMKIWLQIDWIFKLTNYGKEHEICREMFDKVIHNVMEEVKINRKNNNNRNNDKTPSILSRMFDIQENSSHFSDNKDIFDQIGTIYTASEDTITIITSFALILFGMYPNIQEKIVEELFDVLGNKKRDLILENLSELKYLEMCIKDVLRLFPIAPYLLRVASEDTKIGNVDIPKGCSVVMAIQNIHRSPQYWEKPNEFYPEHFLPEKVKERHPCAYLAFSAGPRNCIGKSFAFMALMTLTATILQHYIIEADGKLKDLKIKTDISIRAKNEYYPIRIKLREQI